MASVERAPAGRTAPSAERGFLDRVHRDAAGRTSRYVLFVPHRYTGRTAVPVILFLHGAGETGTDGRRQAEVGLGAAVRKREARFGSIVVFPQSKHRTWRADSEDGRRAVAILDEVCATYRVDARRTYLTGLSMGGYGTWGLAAKYPERWAAMAPVCGGGDPRWAPRIKDIPCWCFHGADDDIVPVGQSREMIEAVRAAGGRPRYTEYAGVGHNSWDRAYGTAALYTWLFKQKLP